MNKTSACILSFALALAGCGGGDPAPATGTMSRGAASVATETSVLVPDERYAATLQHLYVAYFGRPAEPSGMIYWDRQLQGAQTATSAAEVLAGYRSNARVRAILDAFADSGESQALYPGNTPLFVDGVYRNLFNRGADLPGLAWWTQAIDSGAITRSEAALMIMLGARNEDALCVANKVAVAAIFYRILTERTHTVLFYTGKRANEIARRMMAAVDAKTDLAAIEPAVRAAIESMDPNVVN